MRAIGRFIGPFGGCTDFQRRRRLGDRLACGTIGLDGAFPFLIFLTAIAAFLTSAHFRHRGGFDLRKRPASIAAPIADEVKNVLLVPRRDVLTFGVALALWFASSGVEAMRVGLNRAYGTVENRNFLLLRLESIGFVLVGTVTFLSLAFLVVLAPVVWKAIVHLMPAVDKFAWTLTFLRFG